MDKMKKAQTIGQVIMFLLAGLVFVLILIYGYRAITGLTKTGEQVELLNFKTDLQSSVETIKRDYGSVQKLELRVPKADWVFFVTDPKIAESHEIPSLESEYPLIYNTWLTGAENVFLLPSPEQSTPILVKDLVVDNSKGYLRIDASSRKISLRVKGTGKTAKVSEWQREE